MSDKSPPVPVLQVVGAVFGTFVLVFSTLWALFVVAFGEYGMGALYSLPLLVTVVVVVAFRFEGRRSPWSSVTLALCAGGVAFVVPLVFVPGILDLFRM